MRWTVPISYKTHWMTLEVPSKGKKVLTERCYALHLPAELVHMIMSYLEPIDMACFALTCTRFRDVSSLVRLPHTPFTLWNGLPALLRRLQPLDACGKPDDSWNICHQCWRYRPTSRSSWENERAIFLREFSCYESSWDKGGDGLPELLDHDGNDGYWR
ncbi:hypothetical protein PT974_08061 [Cladobotryum mycophilum]|uniref:F-box domain-containing protein n=1 Tax=Cladobotryum mycophilum TaxID=491253 RepID=A0ABR0SCC1_9HYPO